MSGAREGGSGGEGARERERWKGGMSETWKQRGLARMLEEYLI